jgi:phosphomannomutase/phosphoglucomutase
VTTAVAGTDTSGLPADPAPALTAIKQRLPQALNVELYSASLDEVLHANYRNFGYAKAAQLMAAPDIQGDLPAQSQLKGLGDRRLTLVLPLGPQQKPSAWVWVELPFAPVAQRFNALPMGGGRLELHQSSDRGEDLELMTHGSNASVEKEPVGKPVPGSSFTIVAVLPGAYIVLPQSVPLAVLLTLAALGAGVYLFWLFPLSRKKTCRILQKISPRPCRLNPSFAHRPSPRQHRPSSPSIRPFFVLMTYAAWSARA